MTDRHADAMSVPSSLDELRRQIAALIYEDPAEIGADDNLVDLGLDSIRAMSLVARWNDAGLAVEWARFAEHPRLRDWWSLISDAESSGRAGGA